jgi:hypothetical protein
VIYQLTGPRNPTSAGELSDAEREQLHLAWKCYCGEDRSAVQLLSENPAWFELWTVVGDGKPVFDYWHLPPDSGVVFHAGEAVFAGIEVIQFGWDVVVRETPTRACVELKELARALARAWAAAHGRTAVEDDDDDDDDEE